jgi:hypothetical protein
MIRRLVVPHSINSRFRSYQSLSDPIKQIPAHLPRYAHSEVVNMTDDSIHMLSSVVSTAVPLLSPSNLYFRTLSTFHMKKRLGGHQC